MSAVRTQAEAIRDAAQADAKARRSERDASVEREKANPGAAALERDAAKARLEDLKRRHGLAGPVTRH